MNPATRRVLLHGLATIAVLSAYVASLATGAPVVKASSVVELAVALVLFALVWILGPHDPMRFARGIRRHRSSGLAPVSWTPTRAREMG